MNLEESIEAMRSGELLLTKATADAAPLTAPSLLPGWTRAHVLAHLAGNAGALGNLLEWARTGVEKPMYASPEARNTDIEHWRQASPDALLAHVEQTRDELHQAVDAMPASAWDVQVRSATGRMIPASEVPWLRTREVWIHAVDLNTGTQFADIGEDVQTAILDEVTVTLSAKPDCPSVRMVSGDREWQLGARPGAVTVTGSTADLLAWLVGRSAGEQLTTEGAIPTLPRWL